MFLFTLWVCRRVESGFILHGLLVAVVAILLFAALSFALDRAGHPSWVVSIRPLTRPTVLVVSLIAVGLLAGTTVQRQVFAVAAALPFGVLILIFQLRICFRRLGVSQWPVFFFVFVHLVCFGLTN